MKIIGLTGPSGAGKGACGGIFSEFGIPTIDTDAVYHELLIPPSICVDELVSRFGNDILTKDGHIDRPKLAKIVFSDKSGIDHADLNRITHAHVLKNTLSLIEEYKTKDIPAVVIDAPLLFEADFDRFCDFTIAVLSARDIRLSRILARDNITIERATERLNAQPSDDFYQSRADHVIVNDKDLPHLRENLIRLLMAETIIKM